MSSGAIAEGMPMPRVFIIEDDSLNAFATGMNDKQYSITVTTGLINALNDAEIDRLIIEQLSRVFELPDWTIAQKSLRVTKSTLAGFRGDFMRSFYPYLRKMRRICP